MVRHIPNRSLLTLWDKWCLEAEAAVAVEGRWTGSHAQVLAGAAEKLAIASAQDRERRDREGWNTPEALLLRWVRLHRLDLEVTGGQLVIRARPRPRKDTPPTLAETPRLFEEG